MGLAAFLGYAFTVNSSNEAANLRLELEEAKRLFSKEREQLEFEKHILKNTIREILGKR